MSRIVYVNGAYVPEEEAKISVFDRGFLMADAVYEVTSVLGGKLIDFEGHAARLRRSLAELDMASPATDEELLAIHRELVARNGIHDGLVYLQVTRGAADRDFAYPDESVRPTLVMFTQAKAQGADDAWMVEEGVVTEGTSNNAYIVTGNTLVTRQLGPEILSGITRAAVLRLAEEAQAADEAFITSATTFVTPVVRIDGQDVGGGRPGPIAQRLRELYIEEGRKAAI